MKVSFLTLILGVTRSNYPCLTNEDCQNEDIIDSMNENGYFGDEPYEDVIVTNDTVVCVNFKGDQTTRRNGYTQCGIIDMCGTMDIVRNSTSMISMECNENSSSKLMLSATIALFAFI